LRFSGVTGTTWQGDMAIDALSLSTTGGGGGCTDVTISITFDNYPEETSWEIRDGATVVASGGTYGSQADGSTLTLTECLDAGCYDFVISDTYGDGICCSYGNGSYTVSSSAGTLASGGSFGSSETTNFCVSGSNRMDNQEVEMVEESIAIQEELHLYPNPTRDQLNIQFDSATEEEVQIRVVDLMGRTLSVQDWSVVNGKNYKQLDVTRMETGTFLLIIASKNNIQSKRFIVSK
jgi:hypothetical protein